MVAPNPKQIAVRIRALFDATVGKKKGKTLRLTRAQFNALAGRKKVEDEPVFIPTVRACKRDGLHLLRVGSAYAVVEAVTADGWLEPEAKAVTSIAKRAPALPAKKGIAKTALNPAAAWPSPTGKKP